MLNEAPIDAVIVATPNFTHAAVLRDVLETRLPVLCEKPLCTTAEDCAWVVDAVAIGLAAQRSIEQGRPIMISEFGL